MSGWTSARWECRAGRRDRGRNVRVGSGRDYGPRASGLDVASAGLAAFSAGRHSSDLSAPFGHVLTTRPLHGTGLARLGRVLPLGIAPMQAGPICLVVDVSPDQCPDADIPAGLGLPVFIFRTRSCEPSTLPSVEPMIDSESRGPIRHGPVVSFSHRGSHQPPAARRTGATHRPCRARVRLGNDGLEMVFVSIHLYRSAEGALGESAGTLLIPDA